MTWRSVPLVMVPLAAACALATSSLYWAQSVVAQALDRFGPSTFVSLAPSATLLGYALGVAALATFSNDLSRPGGLARHGAFLSAALCLAAASPSGGCLAFACLAIGVGSALTQRVLVTATSLVTRARQSQAIGVVIAAGLIGIVFARASVADAAAVIGWRQMFLADAAAVLVAGFGSAWLNHRRHLVPATRPDLPSPLALLRKLPELRSAAVQQAIAFAIFNMGWSIFPGTSHASPMTRALIAGSGAIAALLSGKACQVHAPRTIALLGLAAIGCAVTLAALAVALRLLAIGPATYVAMMLLEVGTQVALVANQARAQAAAPSVPVRGRLAAVMTTVAFAGGATGAAIGNILLR